MKPLAIRLPSKKSLERTVIASKHSVQGRIRSAVVIHGCQMIATESVGVNAVAYEPDEEPTVLEHFLLSSER